MYYFSCNDVPFVSEHVPETQEDNGEDGAEESQEDNDEDGAEESQEDNDEDGAEDDE